MLRRGTVINRSVTSSKDHKLKNAKKRRKIYNSSLLNFGAISTATINRMYEQYSHGLSRDDLNTEREPANKWEGSSLPGELSSLV